LRVACTDIHGSQELHGSKLPSSQEAKRCIFARVATYGASSTLKIRINDAALCFAGFAIKRAGIRGIGSKVALELNPLVRVSARCHTQSRCLDPSTSRLYIWLCSARLVRSPPLGSRRPSLRPTRPEGLVAAVSSLRRTTHRRTTRLVSLFWFVAFATIDIHYVDFRHGRA
jgi:hypothetical protein